MEKKRFHFS